MINHKVLKRDLFRTGFEICTTVSLNWAMPLESNETIHSCSIENQNYEISCADAEILEISCSEPDQFLPGENFSVSFYSFLPTSTLQWKNWMSDYGIQHSLLWWIKLIFFFFFFFFFFLCFNSCIHGVLRQEIENRSNNWETTRTEEVVFLNIIRCELTPVPTSLKQSNVIEASDSTECNYHLMDDSIVLTLVE